MADITKIPSEQQVEVLMSDWFSGIRNDDYIHKDVRGAIYHKLRKDDNISSFIFGRGSKTIEALRDARAASQNIINSMVPGRVNVIFGDSACTDGRSIKLPTDQFDSNYSEGEKIDITLGYAVHEAAHINHSDFGITEEMSKKAQNGTLTQLDKLRFSILNMIEDERIEYLVGDRVENGGDGMPGYMDFVAKAKKHSFGRYEKMLNNQPTEKVVRLLNAILKALRYPPALTKEEVVEFYKQMNKVRGILSPLPLTAEEALRRSDEIIEVIKEMIEDDMKNARQQQSQQQEQSQGQQGAQQQQEEQEEQEEQGEGQGQDSGQNGASCSQENEDNNQDSENQDGESQDGEGQNDSQSAGVLASDEDSSGNDSNNSQSQGSSGGNGASEDGSAGQDDQSQDGSSSRGAGDSNGPQIDKEELEKEFNDKINSQEFKNILNSIEKNYGNNENKSANVLSANEKNISDYVNEECDFSRKDNRAIKTKFEKRGDAFRYNQAKKEIARYIPAVSRALRCKSEGRDYVLRGKPDGKLNTNKLVSILAGNDNIFTKRGTINTEAACVCLLIDESGSMCGRRIEEARKTAVLLNEAVKGISNLEYYCYGFTSNGCVEISVYHENGSNRCNKYALGNIKDDGGTPTGIAMLIAQERIRAKTKSQCVMFVVTDGEPDNEQYVIQAREKCKKDNITVIGVDVRGVEVTMKRLFENVVSIRDMSTLALSISTILKKYVKKLKIKDSLR